jgi:hypothetical protein
VKGPNGEKRVKQHRGTAATCFVVAVAAALAGCGDETTGAYHDSCGDASACGGSNAGGQVTGGSATGGQVTGGQVMGGAATGGQVIGGANTGGAGREPMGGAGGAGGEARTGARVGGECVNPEDCATGFCLDSNFAQSVAMDPTVEVPGGYCTDLSCQATPDCRQDDASCIDLRATGLDIPFKACFQTCDPEAMPSVCRADHACYCDPEGDITDTEMNRGLCLCLPEVLIDLISQP